MSKQQMAFSEEELARMVGEITKRPRRRMIVAQQLPPAGSRVPRGTSVHVRLVDPWAIPMDVIEENAPAATTGVPTGDIIAIMEQEPEIMEVLETGGTLTPKQTQKLNAAGKDVFKGQMSPEEANRVVRSVQKARHVK